MFRFIRYLLMTLGVLVILGMALGWFWFGHRLPKMPTMPQKAVLEIDLTKRVVEQPQVALPMRWLSGQVIALHDVIEAIYCAAEDPRVNGMVVWLGDHDLGLAQVQELRTAIHYLRQRGKFAYAHADTLDEGGVGTKAYYLAAAFDMVAVQPMGGVGLVGLRAEVPFAKKLLEKLGVTPRFEKREEHKTFPNSLTEENFTPAHRESMQQLLTDLHQQIVREISKDRQLALDAVANLCNKGPFTAQEALGHKLVDRLAYADEVRDMARERAGKNSGLVPFWFYNAVKHQRKLMTQAKVAVVHATGVIQTEDIDRRGISPKLIAKVFKEIRADKQIRAVVVRIDSGGGSATASETIWREIVCCQRAGIPVVVSMSNVVASGGYMIAAPANYIFALPGTITGSIGVYSGKLVLKGVWDQVGVNWGAISTGDNADMFSSNKDFTPYGQQRLKDMVDNIYTLFLQKVAEGRELPIEHVKAVAGGRVWTGQQALEHKLIDEIGGLPDAIGYAKKLIPGIATPDIGLEHFPRPKTLAEQIMTLLGYLEADEDDIGLMAHLYHGYLDLRAWIASTELATKPVSLGTIPVRIK